MAATWARRIAPSASTVLLDSARLLGAKILVAGGGRCNVTHHRVSGSDYRGGQPEAIRAVLRRFPVKATIDFFAELGVELKQEETGKLFPVTDSARTVLDALVNSARDEGVQLRHPVRVHEIAPPAAKGEPFVIHSDQPAIEARRVIMCTGGKSLPKSGSDGTGLAIAAALGHELTPLIEPALVPLTLAKGHWVTELSGLSCPVELRVVTGDQPQGRKVHRTTADPICGALLCTHFGISGPAVLDISRHWVHAHAADASARIRVNWMAPTSTQALDAQLKECKGQSVISFLHGKLPERIARALCKEAGVDPAVGLQQVTREQRQRLSLAITSLDLKIEGTRGFVAAETTCGGVALDQVRIDSLESRLVPGLYLCGEMLDVDGRIGGFSFQWAWASGNIAGSSAARSLTP